MRLPPSLLRAAQCSARDRLLAARATAPPPPPRASARPAPPPIQPRHRAGPGQSGSTAPPAFLPPKFARHGAPARKDFPEPSPAAAAAGGGCGTRRDDRRVCPSGEGRRREGGGERPCRAAAGPRHDAWVPPQRPALARCIVKHLDMRAAGRGLRRSWRAFATSPMSLARWQQRSCVWQRLGWLWRLWRAADGGGGSACARVWGVEVGARGACTACLPACRWLGVAGAGRGGVGRGRRSEPRPPYHQAHHQ